MINRGRGDIRRLAAASAISGTGDWAASTALALAAYAKTGPACRTAEAGPVPHPAGS
jgi:hypothetical protein